MSAPKKIAVARQVTLSLTPDDWGLEGDPVLRDVCARQLNQRVGEILSVEPTPRSALNRATGMLIVLNAYGANTPAVKEALRGVVDEVFPAPAVVPSPAPRSKAIYHTCCVDSDGPSITDMADRASQISYDTFRRHCDVDAVARKLGYAVGSEPGLHLKDDWHVRYHKSVYRGMPCYYMMHSAIEHVFIRPEVLAERERRNRQKHDPHRVDDADELKFAT